VCVCVGVCVCVRLSVFVVVNMCEIVCGVFVSACVCVYECGYA